MLYQLSYAGETFILPGALAWAQWRRRGAHRRTLASPDIMKEAERMSLTEADKAWIKTELSDIRTEVAGLRTEVAGLRTEVDGLRTEIAGVRIEVDGLRTEVAGLRTEVDGLKVEVEGLKTGLDGVKAEVERVETALLTEFHKWASPVEMRQRSHSAAIRALDIEVEALSDRVTKLENRQQQ